MTREQKLYNTIIKDFTVDVLKKNNINDPIEIFYLFCDLFRKMTFSKDTNVDEFFISERDLLKDENPMFNKQGELLSDKMIGIKNKDYLGMFMVNGDGVCRHINTMLADILKKMGYKTYILYGPTNNGDINVLSHAICAVIDKDYRIIYLDAMKRKILYENRKDIITLYADLECASDKEIEGYQLKAMDYSIKALNRIDKFVYYRSKFKNNDEIKEYVKGLKLVKKSIYKDANKFRIAHKDMFEEISDILHDKYDYTKRVK